MAMEFRKSSTTAFRENVRHFHDFEIMNKKQCAISVESIVYQGTIANLGKVAVKEYHRPVARFEELQELIILQKLRHHHIVQLFGILVGGVDDRICFGFIMDYMNQSLDKVIHDKSINYDHNQIYSWLQQAASAFIYLHEQNIVHRNIKPSNLLLGNTLNDLKVADFGHARQTLGESSKTREIGTVGYTAPEVFLTGEYNNAADVYSFTITIWEIFHRKKPLNEFNDKITKYELTTKVIEGWHPAIESSLIEPDMKRLLERGWHKDPLKRITFKEILDVVQLLVAVQQTILVLGGYNENEMHLLMKDRTKWSTFSLKPPAPVARGGAVYLHGEIYIFGGGELNKKTYKLNREMKWIQLANMNEERGTISNSSVVFNGCIWVFGGWNYSEKQLNSVEKYKPEENKWIRMVSMKEKRDDAAAAACKGMLFVCGGYNGDRTLRSMECFDPTNQIWTMFLDLPAPTWGHALISDGICLTVLGGCGEEKSVWKINPNEENASWRKLPQMRESRWNFSANLLGNNVFAIGGGGRSKKVEFFNGETWNDGPELPEEIGGLCSVVISAHLAAALSSRPCIEPHMERLLERGWHKDPLQRLTFKEILDAVQQTLLVFGGFDSKQIQVLSSDKPEWDTLSVELPEILGDGGGVCLNDEIYVFGGYALKQNIHKLNENLEWVKLPDMNHKRSLIRNSSLSFEGYIWVLGGYDETEHNSLSSVEKYTPKKNRWIEMPSMNERRNNAAAAACQGKIFVCGGKNVEECSKSVECFDSQLSQWILFVDLPDPRAGHVMVASGSSLIVMGGEYNGEKYNTVWKINSAEKNVSWMELWPMNETRSNFTAITINNRIIAIGGEQKGSIETFTGTIWEKSRELAGKGGGNFSIAVAINRTAAIFPSFSKGGSIQEGFGFEQGAREEAMEQGVSWAAVTRAAAAERPVVEQQEEREVEWPEGVSTILVFGGERQNEMLLLNSRRSRWITLSLELPRWVKWGGAACLNETIYLFGGCHAPKKTFKLIIQNVEWVELETEMTTKRLFISNSSIVFEDCIWVFGGRNSDDGSLASIEKYDPLRDVWVTAGQMLIKRHNAAVAECLGKIFICGGKNGQEALNSVECFDPQANQIIMFTAQLPFHHNDPTALSFGHHLTLLGGPDLQNVWKINTVEDPTWLNQRSMHFHRTEFTASSLEATIYAIGGKELNSVEVCTEDQWAFGPTLPAEYSSMPSVVISSGLAATLFNK